MRHCSLPLLAIIALASLMLAALRPAVSQAEPNPAQTLAGQQVTGCKQDVRFRFAVVSADWTKTIVDRTAPANTLWAVAVADVTNLGQHQEYSQGLVKVRDNQGRDFPWQLFNGTDIYVETALGRQYNVTPSWEVIGPGVTTRTVLIFPVAQDAQALTLLPNDLACTAALLPTVTPTSALLPTATPTPSLTALTPTPTPSPPTATPNPAAPTATPNPAAPTATPNPAAPTATPTPMSPAATLIGQSVTACKGELHFRFDVVNADWRKTLIDRPARGSAMWAVVIADVTNLGPFTDAGQGLAKVKDDQGREFPWRLFNGADVYVEDQIAAEFGLRPSWDVFTPGITERTVLLFEVAGDARSLTLLPDNLGCT